MKIGIIGAGRVGGTLAIVFVKNGSDVFVASRHKSSADRVTKISGATSSNIAEAAQADVVFLSVPDDEIKNAAFSIKNFVRNEQVVLHLSGAFPASIMDFLNTHIGALHPLKSFSDPVLSAKTFENTIFTFDGDNAAFNAIVPLINKIGCRIIRINSEDKPLYHLSAVIAANYTVTLLDISNQILQSIGFSKEDAKDALLSLVNSALENVQEQGIENALTGPILRGDAETIKLHLQSIEDENLKNIYKSLAFATLDIARRGGLSKIKIAKIREVLNG